MLKCILYLIKVFSTETVEQKHILKYHNDLEIQSALNYIKSFKKVGFNTFNNKAIYYRYSRKYLSLITDLKENKEASPSKVVLLCILNLIFKINYRADLTIRHIYDEKDKFISLCTGLDNKTKKNKQPEKLTQFLLPYLLDENFFKKKILKVERKYKNKHNKTGVKLEIRYFNKFLKRLNKLNEEFYNLKPRNYLKRFFLLKEQTQVNGNPNFATEIEMLKENYDFNLMDKFLGSYQSLIDLLVSHCDFDTNRKFIHHISSNMLLKYKSLILILFQHKNDVFTNKFLPKYKIVNLYNLYFDLHYSNYILAIKIARERSRKLFVLYRLFLMYKNMKENTFQLLDPLFDYRSFICSDSYRRLDIKCKNKNTPKTKKKVFGLVYFLKIRRFYMELKNRNFTKKTQA
ncbi:hypothetical protein TUBRATIS_24050 [Tubulinosema ratisbonensis]|uniref:Uncharacterized protein n=1 Tax=Tubulinosema ratisbonensis TaxID=291195 RepID=A0A437AJ34_9MICR|nr:hypothetical protein TUBRATIS_24050 [Tubulinosema ratisbonensis]